MGEIARFVRLAAVVRDEIASVERVIEEARAIPCHAGAPAPNSLELRGAGAVIHDYYTGIERILDRVVAEFDGGAPPGPAWHRELLRAVALPLPGVRPPVLSRETVHTLDEYLRFRHLFRHVYGFELEWDRVRPLLGALPACWGQVSLDLSRFLDFLDGLASA